MQDIHDERRIPADPEPLPAREAEARRTLAQPGVRPEAAEKALRVLSRIGSGGAK